jgi:hypothetical protein
MSRLGFDRRREADVLLKMGLPDSGVLPPLQKRVTRPEYVVPGGTTYLFLKEKAMLSTDEITRGRSLRELIEEIAVETTDYSVLCLRLLELGDMYSTVRTGNPNPFKLLYKRSQTIPEGDRTSFAHEVRDIFEYSEGNFNIAVLLVRDYLNQLERGVMPHYWGSGDSSEVPVRVESRFVPSDRMARFDEEL